MTDTLAVAPMNMGTRLIWDEKSKKYNVNVDDLIARIVALENKPVHEPVQLVRIDDPNVVFNLDRDLTGFGMAVFYGNIAVGLETGKATIPQNTDTVLYVPCIVKGMIAKYPGSLTTGEWYPAGYTVEDFTNATPVQDYDFLGYQFATPVEIVQVIFHGGRTATRTNDAGMNPDGSLVNPNGWSRWRAN